MTELRLAQIKFSRDMAKLILFAESKGINCIPHELGLLSQRSIILPNGTKAKGIDCVHLTRGNHYRFLAFDLIVWNHLGTRITSGMDPVWTILGKFWESLDPNNDNGREWGDANHFSRVWNGIK